MSPAAHDLETRLSTQRGRAAEHGQEHLLAHWETLDEAGRARLLGQLEAVDYGLMARLAGLLGQGGDLSEPELAAPEVFPLERDAETRARAETAQGRGAELLGAGRVGFMIVAGGQGSRLGYDGPKGCFTVGPVTERSLFEWHARRILAAGRRHGFRPTWYVMTSPANDAATRAFFERHGHFGLGVEDVFFFSQSMLPAMDLEGRLLLSAPDSLFLAPNGHGGSLAALATSGALAHMAERGIETVSYFQVDNPLARPADSLFLGLHAEAGAGMSSKVVPKRDAAEKVGVLGLIDGRMGCIEYSDLSDELREARTPEGKLLFGAGNIAVHAIERSFVERLTSGGDLDLPWHIARKRMKVHGEDGALVEVEGAKFETFVFDALGKSEASLTMEVERHLEFSAVKNASGSDSAASCRADLTALFRRWLDELGRAADAELIEVDPLFAEDEHEFRARIEAGGAERALPGGLLFDDQDGGSSA